MQYNNDHCLMQYIDFNNLEGKWVGTYNKLNVFVKYTYLLIKYVDEIDKF